MKSWLKRLITFKKTKEQQPEWFDSKWYLMQYPDVAAAGIDAWKHFSRHGSYEGRVPCQSHAELWVNSTLPASILEELEVSLTSDSLWEVNYAAWLLARWYAARSDWQNVILSIKAYNWELIEDADLNKHRMPVMLHIEALRCIGKIQEAQTMLSVWEGLEGTTLDSSIAQLNLLHSAVSNDPVCNNIESWLQHINNIYLAKQYIPLKLVADKSLSIDRLITEAVPAISDTDTNEKVSIIIPTYNAGARLLTAVNSLCNQTWPELEILIVDDASTDTTLPLAYALAKQDPRIRVIEQSTNQGAYAARNAGLRNATGELITVHDSDDWSHPQKIEQQVLALRNSPEKCASVSFWVRVSEALLFGSWQTPSGWVGYCHRNSSSLMIRREVFEKLGYWDRVNCSADTEYHHRILTFFGSEAVIDVAPNVPLSLGRMSEGSLTQAFDTSIFTIFSGVRQQYDYQYHLWHASVENRAMLYLPEFPEQRPFPAPATMLR